MKNQMYIALLVLPLLAGCGNKKEAAHTMPAPEISVARPSVQDITLTKHPVAGYIKDKCFSKLNQLFIKIMCDRRKRF